MAHLTDFLPFEFSSLDIFIPENMFFICAAIFWMLIASIQDFRKREVENWWNFGMIIFVLAFRAFLSVERWNYMYFVWGLVGLSAGFLLANGLYYARMFAAGDAKLLMGLMGIIPLSLNWKINLSLFISLFILILIVGAIYGAVYSIVLVLLNSRCFVEDFAEKFRDNSKLIIGFELVFLLGLIITLMFEIYFAASLFGLLMLIPLLSIYAKSIEDSCMNDYVEVKNLTIGDWLVKPVRAGGKTIKPHWEGLTEEQLKDIQRNCKDQKILVKQGIPFVPVFLLAFIALLIVI